MCKHVPVASNQQLAQGTDAVTGRSSGLSSPARMTLTSRLCRAALGMYELPLAYMVIAHSQRDPGEYLLELQGFAGKPSPALRHHAIDAHLGCWPQALRHLVSAGEQHFEAALKLAQDKASLSPRHSHRDAEQCFRAVDGTLSSCTARNSHSHQAAVYYAHLTLLL